MTIQVQCICGSKLRVKRPANGQTVLVRCPHCGRKHKLRGDRTANVRHLAGSPQPPGTAQHRSAPTCHQQGTGSPNAASNATGSPAATGEPAGITPAGNAVESSAWLPHRSESDRRAEPPRTRARRLALIMLLLVPFLIVGTLLLLPMLQPKDPRELVAANYLSAVAKEDWAAANRLSVLAVHPRISGYERVWLRDRQQVPITGPFQAIAQWHASVLAKYSFDAQSGRFRIKDTLALGLDVLGQLEQAKERVEKAEQQRKRSRQGRRAGPEEELLDEVLARYKVIADLADGAAGLLSTTNIAPSYADLLQQCQFPLSDAERHLAALYAREPQKWDRLLGRSFLTLPASEQFQLQQAELVAIVYRPGQSYGGPGQRVILHMIRFRMGTIDTGWKVWSVQFEPAKTGRGQ